MKSLFVAVACVAACSSTGSHGDLQDAASFDANTSPDATTSPDALDASTPTPDPGQSSLVTDRETAVAGVDTVLVTVTLRDASGHPIAGLQVALVATGSGDQISTPALTDSNGVTTATWTCTHAGNDELSLLVAGAQVATHTVAFTPGPVAQLAFITQPSNTIAGAPLAPAIEVAVEDSNGNVVTGATGYVQIALSANPQHAGLFGYPFAIPVNGIATFGPVGVPVAGTGYTLHTSLPGVPNATSASFDVVPGPPDQAHSRIDAFPASLDADGVSTTLLTVHVANPYGIALGDIGVSLSVSGSNNTLAPTAGMTATDGTMTASLSSTTAELKTVTATIASTFDVTLPVHFYAISCRPQLPTGPPIPVDHPPQHMIAADVDGDGHVDAIIAEPGYQIAIYRGRGDGTFNAPTSLPLSTQVNAMTTGDFNNDGFLDLVIALKGVNSLEFFAGTGNGNFAAPTTVSLPAEAYALAVGDFDRNGKLDLALSLPNLYELLIEIGAGNGTFSAGSTITNVFPGDVVAADVNNDGKLDVLTNGASAFYAALGNGTGGFAAPVYSMSEGGEGGKLLVGDFNHDNKLDVLVAYGGEVASMLGNGNGSFTMLGNAIPTADYPTHGGSVFDADGGVIVDLDADGKVDALVESGGILSILKGGGDGTFTLASAYVGGRDMMYVDADGDGTRDVIAMAGQNFGVIPGVVGGGFRAPGVHVAPGTLFPATSDLDGNGQLDLVRDSGGYGLFAELSHLDGSITDASTVSVPLEPFSLALADVTGDGRADLVAIDSAVTGVKLDTAAGNGDGTFQSVASQAIATPYVTALFPANLNGDSQSDLVFTSSSQSGVWFALAQSNGTFGALQAVPGSPLFIAVRDVTGDGISDLLARDSNGDLVVFVGTGTGGLASPATYRASGLLDAALLGDVDRDGALDVVMLHQDSISKVYSIAVMRGSGTGAFGPPIVTPNLVLPSDLTFYDLHLADLTGEGNLDLVGGTNGNYGAVVIAGYGDGYFRQHAFFYPFINRAPLVISDHNADGRPDIAFSPAMGIAIALDVGCAP